MIGVSEGELDFEWTTLRQESFALAVSEKHELVKKRIIKPSDLDEQRLLLLSRVDYPGYWKEVSNYFSQHNINAKVAGEFDGIASLRLGLEAGLGVALVAKRARLGKHIKLKKMQIPPDPICVGVARLRERQLQPWVAAFIEELKLAADYATSA